MKISIHETESSLAPRRSQAARREKSDRRMLSAATRLIAKRGVSGTSLADVGIEQLQMPCHFVDAGLLRVLSQVSDRSFAESSLRTLSE